MLAVAGDKEVMAVILAVMEVEPVDTEVVVVMVAADQVHGVHQIHQPDLQHHLVGALVIHAVSMVGVVAAADVVAVVEVLKVNSDSPSNGQPIRNSRRQYSLLGTYTTRPVLHQYIDTVFVVYVVLYSAPHMRFAISFYFFQILESDWFLYTLISFIKMSFGILRESRDSVSTTYGAKDFADWENSKTDSAEISKIWSSEFDKAPGAPVNRPEPVKTGSNDRVSQIPNSERQNRITNHHSPYKNVSYDNRNNSSPIGQSSINQSKFANLSINSNGKQQNVFIGGQQNGNINLLNIQNTSHVVGHVTPTVTTVGSNFTTTSNFMFNNNQYQIQRNFKQPVQATGMTYNAQQPQQVFIVKSGMGRLIKIFRGINCKIRRFE